MITSNGRDIMSKYLIGQTTSFASHIAIGSGAIPTPTLSDYSQKTELDFEMTRVPIISRSISTESISISATSVQATGTVFIFTISGSNFFNVGQNIVVSGATNFNNGLDPATTANRTYTILSQTATTITVADPNPGDTAPQTLTGQSINILGYVPQIVFSAELPVLQRFEITEFGIYPSGTNTYPNGTDSYILTNFTQNEAWQFADYDSVSTNTSFINVPYYSTITDATNNITVTDKAFITSAENSFFNSTRIARQERPRYYSDAMIVAGDMSEFTANFVTTSASEYIYVPFSADLSQNSSQDELRIAMSLINKLATPSAVPKSINIMLVFLCSNGTANAKYHFRLTNSGTLASATNRYNILTLKLGDTTYSQKTTDFDWKNVRSMLVYASVETAIDYTGSPTSEFSICLDAIRFENKSNTNPLYGLTGYTIVNTDGTPIVKDAGTNNIVEFKFAVGVTKNV